MAGNRSSVVDGAAYDMSVTIEPVRSLRQGMSPPQGEHNFPYLGHPVLRWDTRHGSGTSR